MEKAPYLKVWIPTNRYRLSTITGQLTPRSMDGMNEIIKANRVNKYVGAKLEKENVGHCEQHIRAAMINQGWHQMTDEAQAVPVRVAITFVEASRRRDVSNIVGGGMKYVLDALTRPHGSKQSGAAAIYDDSPKWLLSTSTYVEYDKDNPGIEVYVRRAE